MGSSSEGIPLPPPMEFELPKLGFELRNFSSRLHFARRLENHTCENTEENKILKNPSNSINSASESHLNPRLGKINFVRQSLPGKHIWVVGAFELLLQVIDLLIGE